MTAGLVLLNCRRIERLADVDVVKNRSWQIKIFQCFVQIVIFIESILKVVDSEL